MNEGMVPVKNLELNRVQEESEEALKALDEVVKHLGSRLSKVLGLPAQPFDSEPVDPKYFSKLAQDIDATNTSIWSIIRELKSLLERLEI